MYTEADSLRFHNSNEKIKRMKLIFPAIVAFFLITSLSFAHYRTKANAFCYENPACEPCRPYRCSDYPPLDYKVDNACVDFCLDYQHTLHDCQKACSN